MDIKWKILITLIILLMGGLIIMVLDLPGGLFGQDDVRETAIAAEGTQYWSAAGNSFHSPNPNSADVQKDAFNGEYEDQAGGNGGVLTVNLPHGATVTAVIVKGNTSTETWTLYRTQMDGTANAMASSTINTADITITTAIIDNSVYGYSIVTSALDINDKIYGAIIAYTI